MSTSSSHITFASSNINNDHVDQHVISPESNFKFFQERGQIVTSDENSLFEVPSSDSLILEGNLDSSKIYVRSRQNSSASASPKNPSSPLPSSDLTNLCDNMTLTNGAQNLPTNFVAVRSFYVGDDDEDNDTVKSSETSHSLEKCVDITPSLSSSNQQLPQMSNETPVKMEVISHIEECLESTSTACVTEPSEEFSTITEKHLSVPLNKDLRSSLPDRGIKLYFVQQPEKQHRARYLTEGSRGAVKDQEGTGHPILQVSFCRPISKVCSLFCLKDYQYFIAYMNNFALSIC